MSVNSKVNVIAVGHPQVRGVRPIFLWAPVVVIGGIILLGMFLGRGQPAHGGMVQNGDANLLPIEASLLSAGPEAGKKPDVRFNSQIPKLEAHGSDVNFDWYWIHPSGTSVAALAIPLSKILPAIAKAEGSNKYHSLILDINTEVNDKYGQTSLSKVGRFTIPMDELKKVNFENIRYDDYPRLIQDIGVFTSFSAEFTKLWYRP